MLSNRTQIFKQALTRRSFLVLSAVAAGRCLLPSAAFGTIGEVPEKTLAFYNLHTLEKFEAVYWRRGRYLAEALSDINHIFRDHRTDEVHPIDTELLDLLHTLRQRLNTKAPFHVVSGYRSPRSNALLRKKSNGVARKSLHLQGKAVDIRVPGFKTSSLRREAVEIKHGGVGYYPRSRFVHVDVGPVRTW